MGLLTLFSIVAAFSIYVESYSPKDCPELFQRYSERHTYCLPRAQTCDIRKSFVTSEEINIILREHNAYRSKIATGKEQKLPPAGNMLQMQWDNELAKVAQAHADQCLFEHDCSNCRRVQNFGVGQNLAIEVTNSPTEPKPNWTSAIKSWYDEISVFPKNAINPFIAPKGEPTYGHFSQLVWAESWRIGCGYVLYQESNMYKKLYTCNYGPAGNMVSQSSSMHKEGAPCSACPVNSCCDKTCGPAADYFGLCKITDGRAPTYKPQGTYPFYCDFNNQPDCDHYVIGQNNWLIYNTLSGNYLGIVLNGGQESTVVFTNRIKPSTSSFCFVTSYRKGPNIDGQEEDSKATEVFSIIGQAYEHKQDLPPVQGDAKQQFSEFFMNLGWNMETEFTITFSVPSGKPKQFFEVQSLYVTEGNCKL